MIYTPVKAIQKELKKLKDYDLAIDEAYTTLENLESLVRLDGANKSLILEGLAKALELMADGRPE